MTPLFVIVLYQTKIENSLTFQSLLRSIKNSELSENRSTLVLFDNSPTPQVVPKQVDSAIHVHYRHAPENSGTSGAYNYALNYAKRNGDFTWLVLLDQDTSLTTDYFQKMIAAVQSSSSTVVAAVPFVQQAGVQLSPTEANHLQMHRYPLKKAGIYTSNLTAIASGAWLQIHFLEEINGFSEEFPLDYLDHWLFQQIFDNHKYVVLVDTPLSHELSVKNMNTVALERYQQILAAEYRYYRTVQPALFATYRRHLFLRAAKQLIRVKNKAIAKTTLHYCLKKKPTL